MSCHISYFVAQQFQTGTSGPGAARACPGVGSGDRSAVWKYEETSESVIGWIAHGINGPVGGSVVGGGRVQTNVAASTSCFALTQPASVDIHWLAPNPLTTLWHVVARLSSPA